MCEQMAILEWGIFICLILINLLAWKIIRDQKKINHEITEIVAKRKIDDGILPPVTKIPPMPPMPPPRPPEPPEPQNRLDDNYWRNKGGYQPKKSQDNNIGSPPKKP